MILKKAFASLLGMCIIVASCTKKEDPVIPNEEELITTFIYTLISQNPPDTVVMRFQDLDGEGGNAPVIVGGTLIANTMYHGDVELLNEIEGEDITEEVKNEAEDHQFFYQVNGGLDAMVTYNDGDQNGNPIGIKTNVMSNAASAGTLTIILKHEPDKNAAGVSDGDITNAGGETDIEVTFDVDVQ